MFFVHEIIFNKDERQRLKYHLTNEKKLHFINISPDPAQRAILDSKIGRNNL